MDFLFYFTALLCGYSYFLYPLVLKLIPARPIKPVEIIDDNNLPRLSLIITAHNEEARIQDKLENSLQIDYPLQLLEVIVASDYSTDATDSIVESYADKGIRLVRADERKGKEYAQLCAIKASTGDILVFSDVATKIPAEAFRLLANYFADNRIGAVSSEDKFISNDGMVVGEGAYVKYEMWLRRLESERAGLVGLSGSFFAARREVCGHWDIYSPSDFNTGLNCAKQGMVAITCPDVLGVYKDVKDPDLEYRRKMRTVIRGVTAISRHPEVLNPLAMGMFAFQVWSHKIMRWGVPWFMLAFAIITLIQQGQGVVYMLALAAQLFFYALAIVGWLSPNARANIAVRIIFFFVQTNLALAQATLMFLAGRRMTVWTPSQR
ncbi:MAG: glycosyltransferase family 2 protein [Gammaproteobacteria bacterium]|nr:glycosyltransferase family 2 protein [Gammaproteobacteria bacterium]